MTRAWSWAWGCATVLVSATGVATVPRAFGDRFAAEVPFPTAGIGSTAPAHPRDASQPKDSAWTSAPFRTDRNPAPTRYSVAAVERLALERAEAEAAALAEQASSDSVAQIDALRPPWTLKGVLLGEPAVAVFEGPSGPDGSPGVLALGSEADGYVVTAIDADHVIVSRGSLTWTFALEGPWN